MVPDWLLQPLPPGLYGLALVTALLAAYFDCRWRIIPNWLVLSALVLGLVGNLWLRGGRGVALAVGGLLLATMVYFPLYLLKGFGAGDVKLMMALGTVLGPRPWVLLLLFTALFGVGAGVLLAWSKGRLKEVLLRTMILFKELAAWRVPYRTHSELHLHHPDAIRMPHGVAIAVGTVAFVVVMMVGR